jgi:hypothetical protein
MQATGALAGDFLTVETVGLTRPSVFFMIELERRRLHQQHASTAVREATQDGE